MIIYTNSENHITTSGTPHEIPDNHPLALMSETKRNCYVYDSGSFYPFVPTNIIEKLEEQEKENELTRQKIEAQSEQMDFYEDCIADMAEIVYA